MFLSYYMGRATFDIPMIVISRSCKVSFPWTDMSYKLLPTVPLPATSVARRPLKPGL